MPCYIIYRHAKKACSGGCWTRYHCRQSNSLFYEAAFGCISKGAVAKCSPENERKSLGTVAEICKKQSPRLFLLGKTMGMNKNSSKGKLHKPEQAFSSSKLKSFQKSHDPMSSIVSPARRTTFRWYKAPECYFPRLCAEIGGSWMHITVGSLDDASENRVKKFPETR